MFKEMQEILARTKLITLSLSMDGDKIRVNFMPKAKSDDDASVTPLSLVGTAEELDAEFITAIKKYSEKNQSIAEQMAEYEKEADAARAEAANRAAEAAKKKQESSNTNKVAPKSGTATTKTEKPKADEGVGFDDLFEL